MKKNDTIAVPIICVGSIFIINIIILLFLHNRDLSTGMAVLLENSLVFFGLLLATMFVVTSMRTKKIKDLFRSYKLFFESILKNTECGLVVLDESNCFSCSNEPFQTLLGLDGTPLIGRNAADVLPKSVYQFIMEYRLTPCSPERDPVRQILRYKDTYLEAAAFTVMDENNTMKCIVTLRDHTKQILMEQKLINQLEEVQRHIEAKESLLANVSHELKTPLNAIIGLNHILEESKLDAHQREIVSKINVSSDYLLSLINDVLDFSKLKNGTLRLAPTHFRLQDLLDDLETMFEPVAAQKGVHLLTDYQFSPDLCLNLDRLRMEQVLVNLLNNACKFTDIGFIRIKACILKEFQDTVTLKFSVEDTGIGIEHTELAEIFTEFYQAEDHLTKIHQGTGMGLPICKYLVEHMGGSLWAESKKGMGSTFFFILTAPKYYGADEESAALPATLDGQGERILVVEDTPINYEVVEDLLTRVNLVCEHAASGLSALNMCEKAGDGYYQAILMDIHMPIMDGYETARKLKEMGITTPIIALTATNMDEKTQIQHRDLFTDYVLKPFKYTQLYGALKPYIEGTAASICTVCAEDPFAGKNEAIENLGGSLALYEKHLARFKTNYAQACEKLEDHLSSGQLDKAKVLAHSIKGLAGTLGLTYLAQSAGTLETAIDDGTDNLSPHVNVFRDKLSQVVNQ